MELESETHHTQPPSPHLPGLEQRPITGVHLTLFCESVLWTFFVPQHLEREAIEESEAGKAVGRRSDRTPGRLAPLSSAHLPGLGACLQRLHLGENASLASHPFGLFAVRREILNSVIIFIF